MQEVYFDEDEYLRNFRHPIGIILMPKVKLESITDSTGKKYTEMLTYDLKRILQKLLYLKGKEEEPNEEIDEKIRAVITILFFRKFKRFGKKLSPDPFTGSCL